MKRLLALSLILITALPVLADLSLPNIFTDGMVLQRNTTVAIWGWAKPRETVKLYASWSNDTLEATADNHSHWSIDLNTPDAGGPFTLFIQGGWKSVILSNVLIGEVWVCSGQSNMEWSANHGIDNAQQAVAAADFPEIRMFTVDHRYAEQPQIDLASTGWVSCTPESMANFSAVGYFFARKLYEEIKVPIGLIDASWGGTPAEAWTPATVYEQDETLAASAAKLQDVPWGPVRPGTIYNAMVAPVTKFKIAGTIWYQGESNTANPDTYKETFGALINSWRSAWDHEFPFYFVQIAPFTYGEDNDNGVRVRDAQRRTLKLPKTAMVVTSDIGDTTDIHPRNKLDVGIRLANLALKHHYQVLDGTVDSPLFSGYSIEKNQVTVNFDHGQGLYSPTGKTSLFELAGADRVFYPARATIKGETVIVQSKQVKTPVYVRYCWGNTSISDLFNGANLPASSFNSEFE